MTTLFYILMVLAPVALFATAFIAVKNRFSGKSIKKPLKMNIAVFAVLVVLISVLCVKALRQFRLKPTTQRVSDFSQQVLLRVLQVSAAVSQLPQVLPQLSQLPQKTRSPSVSQSSSLHWVSQSLFTALLFQFLFLTKYKGKQNENATYYRQSGRYYRYASCRGRYGSCQKSRGCSKSDKKGLFGLGNRYSFYHGVD